MTKQEIEIEIETLKMAIGVNTAFLKGMAKNSDVKTEKQIETDRAELKRLREMLEAM